MKRNGSVIGKEITTSSTNATGVHDTFDAYNFKRWAAWPLVYRYLSLSPNTATILENTSQSFTFTTSGLEVSKGNETLYWTIAHGTTTSTDFFGSTVSGSFTQTASTNTGTFSVITSYIGDPNKATRNFQIQIRTGSISGPVVYTSGIFYIPPIAVSSFYWSSTPINEGSSSSLYLQYSNVGSYTSYVHSISYGGNASTTLDLSSAPSTSVTIFPSSFSTLVTVTANADFLTETTEVLTANVSYSGYNHGRANLVINDTSLTVTANITSNVGSINEGGAVLFTVTTTNFTSGTLYWDIEKVTGNILATDFSTALNGSTSISSSTGTVTVATSADTFDEGSESFRINIRRDSVTGPIVGTSSSVTINDTSTGGGPEPSALYSFTAFTFTNAGITGRLGPTLANCTTNYNTAANTWLTNTAYFNVVTQGYQLWTVPATGPYRITAIGAVGGLGYIGSVLNTAGKGAQMESIFNLTQGDKYNIIVGQAGTGGSNNSCGGEGGGGGGSFVFTSGGTCILAAGGGGGGSQNGFNRDPTRRDAPNSTSGNAGSGTTGGAGGTGGSGGFRQVGSCVSGGAAGAGINSGGQTDGQANAAQPYSGGFTGGTGGNNGGFGGGGGAGTNYAAGGGGGYSGGGGGGLQTCSCNDMGNGGGGGSYSSNATYTYTGSAGTGQGSITIVKL